MDRRGARSGTSWLCRYIPLPAAHAAPHTGAAVPGSPPLNHAARSAPSTAMWHHRSSRSGIASPPDLPASCVHWCPTAPARHNAHAEVAIGELARCGFAALATTWPPSAIAAAFPGSPGSHSPPPTLPPPASVRSHATAWPAVSAGTAPPLVALSPPASCGSKAALAAGVAEPCLPSPSSRFTNVRTQRTLIPNSTPACFWVMCRFLTSCSTFSRSRSFADIHSPSCASAMPYQSGTFYFAQRGTSHIAATPSIQALIDLDSRRILTISSEPSLGNSRVWICIEPAFHTRSTHHRVNHASSARGLIQTSRGVIR